MPQIRNAAGVPSGRRVLLGCFRCRRGLCQVGSSYKVATVIRGGGVVDNSAKQLEAEVFRNTLVFNDLIGDAGLQPGVFFALPARPVNYHPVDLLLLSEAKRRGQF